MRQDGTPTQAEDAATATHNKNRKNLKIHGEAGGEIAGRTVTVLEGASVDGTVDAQTIVIHGVVRGLVSAASIAVRSTAYVAGELRYGTLSVDSGARVDALCVPAKPTA